MLALPAANAESARASATATGGGGGGGGGASLCGLALRGSAAAAASSRINVMSVRARPPAAATRRLAGRTACDACSSRGATGTSRSERQHQRRGAEHVAVGRRGGEPHHGVHGAERDAEQPSRDPHAGDDAAGDRRLGGDHAPAAAPRSVLHPPSRLAQRHGERAQQVEHPADPGPRKPDRHRQCPFSYTCHERPSSSSAQTARRKKSALTVRSTKNAGTLATARRTSPRRAAPASTGTSTAGASIT